MQIHRIRPPEQGAHAAAAPVAVVKPLSYRPRTIEG
ncbi:hypothetical protein DV517_67360 [Streptomyces sp. S816]|nr:hypothetical protein DV517_67360 [Streptomyces sp. S816]